MKGFFLNILSVTAFAKSYVCVFLLKMVIYKQTLCLQVVIIEHNIFKCISKRLLAAFYLLRFVSELSYFNFPLFYVWEVFPIVSMFIKRSISEL